MSSFYNFIYPKNPITGRREFWFLPKYVEDLHGNQMQNEWRGRHTIMLDEARIKDRQTPIKAKYLKMMQTVASRVLREISKHAQTPERKLGYEVTVIDTGVLSDKKEIGFIPAMSGPGGKVLIPSSCIKACNKAISLKNHAHGIKDRVSAEDVLAFVASHETAHIAIGHWRKNQEISLLSSLTRCLSLLGLGTTAFSYLLSESAANEKKVILTFLGLFLYSEYQSCLKDQYGKKSENSGRIEYKTDKHTIYLLGTTACSWLMGNPTAHQKKIICIFLGLLLYSEYQNFLENEQGRALERSRKMEYEADEHALYLMNAANYNMRGSIYFLEMLEAAYSGRLFEGVFVKQQEENLSKYPSIEKRIEACRKTIQEIEDLTYGIE